MCQYRGGCAEEGGGSAVTESGNKTGLEAKHRGYRLVPGASVPLGATYFVGLLAHLLEDNFVRATVNWPEGPLMVSHVD
jgi:hypothetical protein